MNEEDERSDGPSLGGRDESKRGKGESLGRRDERQRENDSLIEVISQLREEFGELKNEVRSLKRKSDTELLNQPSQKAHCSRTEENRTDVVSILADEDLDYMININTEDVESDLEIDGDILDTLEKEVDVDKMKGPDIDNKLAKVIAARFTSRLDENIMKEKTEKYKLPGNCAAIAPPTLNEELLQAHIGLKRGARRDDARLMAVQRMVTKATTALASSVEKLHDFADKFVGGGKSEMKKMANEVIEKSLDACAFLGQAQQDLSLRRKFQIMKDLPADIKTICYQKTSREESDKLFGNDVNKDMKEAREAHRLNVYKPKTNFGYGRRPFLGGRGRGYHQQTSANQFRPYQKRRGQQTQSYQMRK